MQLISAQVGPLKSIDEPQLVRIDPQITVLVGMNEAGKTVFLQALQKSDDVLGLAEFDPVEDYPRKDLPPYLKVHKTKPARATSLTYRLTDAEVAALNAALKTDVEKNFEFSIEHKYDNVKTISLRISEKPVLAWMTKESGLSSDAAAALGKVDSLRAIPAALKALSLTDHDKAWLAKVEKRIADSDWNSVVGYEAWLWLEDRVPKFAFFGDYELLPSKMNLADLARRVQQAKAVSKLEGAAERKAAPKTLEAQHRAVLALLRMADIAVDDFTAPGGYEQLKAKLEGVSIGLTDDIMEFWKQNEDLEVEIDIKPDPEDHAPFNNGPNLYLRIKNRRHRGVSTPFHQRSRGFTWFFSFLVWFDNVRHQLEADGDIGQRDLVLLLDEPGLNLHALAQADFLRYIDKLATKHQVLYSTHSPFMVPNDRLHQVRVVEDRPKVGTVISENVDESDSRTIFPLQAALGWSVAQNLFISERNLLVEGPSDLLYLKAVSLILENAGRTGLRDDITIVPTGGLDKVVTFIALLGANGLKLAVLHDYRGKPEQKLEEMVRQKLLHPKALLNASQFRDARRPGGDGKACDTEDLLSVDLYLDCFNKAFNKQLAATKLKDKGLPKGDRIIDRIERYLVSADIQLRPSGGFNHYSVASQFAINPPSLDDETLTRFELLIKAVNANF